ncbi:hypothetical protein, partial [Streptomyces botrytidirepellens]
SGWTLRQVRAEIGRREAYAHQEPVAYWLQRLTTRAAELSAEYQLRSLPRHPGLRVVPNRARSPWTYAITLRQSGQTLNELEYPEPNMAHEAADRLVAACDWKVPATEHTPEHRAAAAVEYERLQDRLGFSSWPEPPDSPEGI